MYVYMLVCISTLFKSDYALFRRRFAWINGTAAAHCQKREIASFLLILSPIKVCQKFKFVGGFSDFRETFDSLEIFQ